MTLPQFRGPELELANVRQRHADITYQPLDWWNRRKRRRRVPASLTRHEQMSVVLRIDLAVAADGCRGVRRAEGQLLKDLIDERPALRDGEQVAVFAVGVHHAVG